MPESEPVVRITVNGRRAATLGQLAEQTGRNANEDLRHALRRASVAPVARLDGRTPLYLTTEALRALSRRQVGPTKDEIVAELRRLHPDGPSTSALRVLRKAELARMLPPESALSKGQDQ